MMKIVIRKAVLVKALEESNVARGRRGSVASILESILIRAEDGICSLFSTDLDMHIQSDVSDVRIEEQGSIAMPYKELLQIVKRMPAGNIGITVEKDFTVGISFGSFRATIAGYNPDDFPILFGHKAEHCFSISRKTLKEMMDKTVWAMAKNYVRQALNGCCLTAKNNTVVLAASDGWVLAETKHCQPVDKEIRVVLPDYFVRRLLKLAKDNNDVEVFLVENGLLRLKCGNVRIEILLKITAFPDYAGILPTLSDEDGILKISREQLLSACQSVIFKDTETIMFLLNNKGLTLTTDKAMGSIGDIQYSAGEVDSTYKAQQLLKLLKNLNYEDICIRFVKLMGGHHLILQNNDDDIKRYYLVCALIEK